jgi:hypothetical protein
VPRRGSERGGGVRGVEVDGVVVGGSVWVVVDPGRSIVTVVAIV